MRKCITIMTKNVAEWVDARRVLRMLEDDVTLDESLTFIKS